MAARPLYKRIRELIAAALGSSDQRNSATGPTDIPSGPLGVICGTAAALFWAAGLAVARQGIDAGLAPVDLIFHRCIWAGLAFLPVVIANGAADLRIFGWGTRRRTDPLRSADPFGLQLQWVSGRSVGTWRCHPAIMRGLGWAGACHYRAQGTSSHNASDRRARYCRWPRSHWIGSADEYWHPRAPR